MQKNEKKKLKKTEGKDEVSRILKKNDLKKY